MRQGGGTVNEATALWRVHLGAVVEVRAADTIEAEHLGVLELRRLLEVEDFRRVVSVSATSVPAHEHRLMAP